MGTVQPDLAKAALEDAHFVVRCNAASACADTVPLFAGEGGQASDRSDLPEAEWLSHLINGCVSMLITVHQVGRSHPDMHSPAINDCIQCAEVNCTLVMCLVCMSLQKFAGLPAAAPRRRHCTSGNHFLSPDCVSLRSALRARHPHSTYRVPWTMRWHP
jgi:hypothetical protein